MSDYEELLDRAIEQIPHNPAKPKGSLYLRLTPLSRETGQSSKILEK